MLKPAQYKLPKSLLQTVALSLFLFALSACSAGSRVADNLGEPDGDPAGTEYQSLDAMPGPLQMISLLHEGRFSVDAGFRAGAGYSVELPHYNVAKISGESLRFSGNAGGSLKHCAYAVYSFTLPKAELGARLFLDWEQPPAPGSCMIGISNWDNLRWDWSGSGETTEWNFANLDAQTDASDRMFLVILLRGQGFRDLRSIQFLQSGAPVANLIADTDSDYVSHTFTFDASGSLDDLEVVSFEWDLDGDSKFGEEGAEQDYEDSALIEHQFTDTGKRWVKVRVGDFHASTSVAELEIEVKSESTHPPQAKLIVDPPTAPVHTIVNLDGSMSSDIVGIVSFEWDLDGDLMLSENGPELDALNQQQTQISFSEPGVYTLRLQVVNALGSGSLAEKSITITAD